jgi:hypothetical protein
MNFREEDALMKIKEDRIITLEMTYRTDIGKLMR